MAAQGSLGQATAFTLLTLARATPGTQEPSRATGTGIVAVVLSLHLRAPLARLLTPFTARLARTRLSPDVVTVVGALGVCGSAIGFFTRGVFVLGTLAITAFVLFDLLDGLLARARGTSSVWGAFLDSTLDRVADGAIFGSLTIWYAGHGHSLPLVGASLFCLVAGAVTSYSRARAESLGLRCDVGFAERAERLIIVLVAAFFYGLGVPYLLPAALWFLAAATLVTVVQRLVVVYRQSAGVLVSVTPPAAQTSAAQTSAAQPPAAQTSAAQTPPAQPPPSDTGEHG